MDIAFIFLILALILFVVAAFGVSSRVNLTAAGLACLTASMIFTGGSIGG